MLQFQSDSITTSPKKIENNFSLYTAKYLPKLK